MLDSMVFDKIASTPKMIERVNQFTRVNKIAVLCTHIQEDELAHIQDGQKRNKTTRAQSPSGGDHLPNQSPLWFDSRTTTKL